jgi:hypothetical protein
MGGLEIFCLGLAVTGVPVGQLSESILAATQIAGGSERRRQVKGSDQRCQWREANQNSLKPLSRSNVLGVSHHASMNDLSNVLRGFFPYPSRSIAFGSDVAVTVVTVCKAPLTCRARPETVRKQEPLGIGSRRNKGRLMQLRIRVRCQPTRDEKPNEPVTKLSSF